MATTSGSGLTTELSGSVSGSTNTVLEYAILSEFDIDQGTCIRAQVPSTFTPAGLGSSLGLCPESRVDKSDEVESQWSGFLTEQVLPDGSEKFEVSHTIVLFRPRRWCPGSISATQDTRSTPSVSSPRASALDSFSQQTFVDVDVYNEPVVAPTTPLQSPLPSAVGSDLTESVALLPNEVRVGPAAGATPAVSQIPSWTRVPIPPTEQLDARSSLSFLGTNPQCLVISATGQLTLVSGVTKLMSAPLSEVQISFLPDTPEGVEQRPELMTNPGANPHSPIHVTPTHTAQAPTTPQESTSSSPSLEHLPSKVSSPGAPSIPGPEDGLTALSADENPIRFGILRHRSSGNHISSSSASDGERHWTCFGLYFHDAEGSRRLQELLMKHSLPAKGLPKDGNGNAIEQPGKEIASATVAGPSPNLLFGLNCVVTRKDPTVRRGAINKALLLIGRNVHYLQALHQVAVDVLDACCKEKGNDPDTINRQRRIIQAFFDEVNNATGSKPLPMREHRSKLAASVSPLQQQVLVRCCHSDRVKVHVDPLMPTWRSLVQVQTTGKSQPASGVSPASSSLSSIPSNASPSVSQNDQQSSRAASSPAQVATAISVRYPLHRTLTEMELPYYSARRFIASVKPEDCTVLFDAIFAQQRVLIVSQLLPAGALSDAALLLALLFEPVYPHLLSEKVFPYIAITSIDQLTSTEGFIAGTANPLLESRAEWWDVCWNLDHESVTLSDQYKLRLVSGSQGNKSNIAKIAAKIQNSDLKNGCDEAHLNETLIWAEQQRLALVPEAEIELGIRLRLSEYIDIIARVNFSQELQRAPDIVEAIRTPNIFRSLLLLRHPTAELHWKSVGTNSERKDLATVAALIRRCRTWEEVEILQRLQVLVRTVHTEEQVLQLLTYFPDCMGGTSVFGQLLLHQSRAVQLLCVAVLRLFDSVPSGKQLVSSMNTFLMLSYEEGKRQHPAAESSFLLPTPNS